MATAAAAADSGGEITVTGSYIAGTPKNAAIPVLVVGRDDLEKTGSPTMLDLIKSLPITGPVLGDTNQFSTAAQGRVGAGSINLRGLGPQRTLVLLNGKRFSVGGVNGADTNMLPLAAVSRVEVLKDGAAATYGSDAIGGVVNFITRKNFRGLEVTGDYRLVDGSDGDWTVSGTGGWSNDTLSVMASVGYQHRSELTTLDRDWANQPYNVNPSGWSVLGNPGSWLPINPLAVSPANPFGAIAPITRDANCTANGGVIGWTGTTPACYFTYVPFDNLIEDQNRLQAYAEVNYHFSDKAKLHLEGQYSLTEIPHMRFSPGYPPTSGPTGPGSSLNYSVPPNNPGVAAFLQQTGLTALPLPIAVIRNVTWRPFANGGSPAFGNGGQIGDRRYNELRFSGDLSGEISDSGIGYDFTATYIREHFNQGTTDILIDRLQRALGGLGGPNCSGTTPGANGCQWFNPFSNAIAGNPALGLTNPGYVSANANDPALVAWLYDKQVWLNTSNTWVLDGVINGTVPMTLPGGAPKWAVGGQYRTTHTLDGPASDLFNANVTPCPVVGVTTCAVKTGPYIFLGQRIPTDLTLSVWGIFAELDLPITDRLDVQLAIRHEDYGGLTGSTNNPQARGKFQATDWLAIRGSIGTSFRGPIAADRAPTGVTALSGITAAGNNFKSVDVFGNPAVGPEKALTWSVGGIIQHGGLTLTADYWYYRLRDQILQVPANTVASVVANGQTTGALPVDCSSPLRPLVTFSNNNACVQGVTVGNNIARVRADTINGPTIRTDGVDVEATYRFADVWRGGDITWGANFSYVFRYDQDALILNGATVSGAYDAVGLTNYDRNPPGTIPHWRGQFFAEFASGMHNLRWTMNYTDGAIDNRAPTAVQTGATAAGCPTTGATNVVNSPSSFPLCQLITFGAKLRPYYEHDFTYRLSLPEDMTVYFSLLNAFDRKPSAARVELSYDPFVGNPYGRSFKVGLRKRF